MYATPDPAPLPPGAEIIRAVARLLPPTPWYAYPFLLVLAGCAFIVAGTAIAVVGIAGLFLILITGLFLLSLRAVWLGAYMASQMGAARGAGRP